MFKKLLIASAILATTSSIAFASNGAPYLGGSLGVSNTTASGSGSFRGVPMTIFGGYGETINKNIYLAGELFGTVGTATLDNNSTGPYGLKSTYGYGASVIPGITLTPNTIAFARAGIIRTHFSGLSSTETGGQFGLGMQTNLMQNWDVRGEYDYTQFGRVKGVKPQTDLFNLGLVYKID